MDDDLSVSGDRRVNKVRIKVSFFIFQNAVATNTHRNCTIILYYLRYRGSNPDVSIYIKCTAARFDIRIQKVISADVITFGRDLTDLYLIVAVVECVRFKLHIIIIVYTYRVV